MRSAYLRLLAVSAISTPLVAEAQLVANLPLTCSSASAIGQPQNNCNGDWAYQTPNERLSCSAGLSSAPTWALAANVAGADAIAVCSLPVEPGGYSGCKDASGVRRIVYLAKSQFSVRRPLHPHRRRRRRPRRTMDRRGSGGARILDLSSLPSTRPIEITVPGVYVLNRDWRPYSSGSNITITANNVTLDLQGFELFGEAYTDGAVIRSTGQDVTIRNGRVINTGTGPVIDVYGARTRIEGVTGTLMGFQREGRSPRRRWNDPYELLREWK